MLYSRHGIVSSHMISQKWVQDYNVFNGMVMKVVSHILWNGKVILLQSKSTEHLHNVTMP